MEALHISTGLAVDVPCLLLDVHRGELVMFGPQRGARFKIGIKFLSLWAATMWRFPIKCLSVL